MCNKSFAKLITITVTFFYSYSTLSAQNCNRNLIPDSSSIQAAYQNRTGDKRCEGLIVKEVSGTTRPFTINSVMVGKLAYELSSDEILKIKAPQTKRFKQFTLTGVSINHSKNYRLDMALNAGEQKKIPVNDVIAIYTFRPEQLRFFYVLPNEDNFFSPVTITSKYYNTPVEDSLLNISALCGINLKNVVIRYSLLDQDGICGNTLGSFELGGSFARRKEVRIEVNLNKIHNLKVADTDLCFVINAKDAATGNDLPAYQFKVFVPKRK